MRVSLNDFLATGRLGDLHIGMSPKQVRDVLREPDDIGGTSRQYSKPSIYLYGTVEFCFRQRDPHELTGIYWEAGVKGAFRLPEHVLVAGWGLTPQSARATVEAFLRSAGLPFERTDSQATQEVTLESGVRIFFDENGRLYAVSK